MSGIDQREFRETRDALQWLATCQMGWYQREEDGGRYRDDMLAIQNNDFTRYGLLLDHGITLRVSKDGQAWFAIRRTVAGWVFAIGASEAPQTNGCTTARRRPLAFRGRTGVGGPSMFETADANW